MFVVALFFALSNSAAFFSGSRRGVEVRDENHALSRTYPYTIFVSGSSGCQAGTNTAAYACTTFNFTTYTASNCYSNTRYCCCGDCDNDGHEWTGNCSCSGTVANNTCSWYYNKRTDDETDQHSYCNQKRISHDSASGYKCGVANYNGTFLNFASGCVAIYDSYCRHHAQYVTPPCGKRDEQLPMCTFAP